MNLPAVIVDPKLFEVPPTGTRPTHKANRYRICGELGRGGTSIVYEAVSPESGVPFAVKVLDRVPKRGASSEPPMEVQLATRLTSPYAIKLFEVGVLRDGRPFLVMERLFGQDAAHRLREHGPLSVSAASEIVLLACHALGEAHRLGIIHQDIKPANLFLGEKPDGTLLVKVLDFGLATMVAPELDGPDGAAGMKALTASGSAGYAAPEQIGSGKAIDERADIWALGVVLYELVTGRRPFESATLLEGIVAAGSQPIPAMGGYPGCPPDISVPPGFEAIVRRCLEKERELRFPSVIALAESLAPFAPELDGFVEGVRRARGAAGPSLGPDRTLIDEPGPTAVDLARALKLLDAQPPPSTRTPRVTAQIRPMQAPRWLAALALFGAFLFVLSMLVSRVRGAQPPPRPAVSAGLETPSKRLPPLPRKPAP
jgi:serine/threonine protein kinase